MAGSREESFSPAPSWATEDTNETADDDMDFELATESALSPSTDEDEGDGEEETTLYFDAEEGTLRAENGAEIIVEMDDDDSTRPSEEPESQEDGEEEGSRTPQASTQARPAQTITSMSSSSSAGSRSRRPGLIRRASSATQRRVSSSNSFVQIADVYFHGLVTQEQILQLLSHAGLRGIFQPTATGVTTRSQARRAGQAQHTELPDDDDDEAPDDDDDSDAYLPYASRRGRRNRRTFVGDRYPKIPSDKGRELMGSGNFGTNDHCNHTSCGEPFSNTNIHKRRKLARRMFDREMGVENRGRTRALNALASQDLIPSSKADLIINLNARCYSGQFSEDGSFFFACGQDFKVRMYDTSNPYDWKYYKTANYYGGQWTITDASLSPDNKQLAYSSIRSQICLANTDQSDTSEPNMLDFSDMGRGGHGFTGGGGWGHSRGHFGIWSLRFSGDGGEIVAGTSDQSVYVYDLEAQRSILRIHGHTDDVNAVCFGDRMSPHILYSGSDDTTLKVWDRRSLASMRPAGMFLGHTEGLTYIDSKGDGRYVISNGKDQTCKLWDLRNMISTDVGERIQPQEYTTNFDYRFSPYDTEDHHPHPHDCSLVTFRGHRVLKTLIRCHFSPPGSTDGRYIYSGSHDGKIYVWNLDGTNASQPINVLAATKNSRPPGDERYVDRYDYYGRGGIWKTIVRDCSWHPSAPVIAATSWNGWDHGLGTCTVHSWNDGADEDEVGDFNEASSRSGEAFSNKPSLGSTPMGARVTAQLLHDERYYGSTNAQQQTARRMRLRDRMGLGTLWAGDDQGDE